MDDVTALPYFIGIPRRRFDDTDWDAWMDRYLLTGPAGGLKLNFPGSKTDVARSRIVSVAKGHEAINDEGFGFGGNLRLPEPPKVTLSMDSDVFPSLSLSDELKILEEDFAAGFHVVGSPIINHDTLMPMVWTKDGTIPQDRCAEVDLLSFGFVGMSPDFVRDVKPGAEEHFWVGTPQESHESLYCWFGPGEDDSTTFSKLVKEQGFKLGVDARLRVRHNKRLLLDDTTASWLMGHRILAGAGQAGQAEYEHTIRRIQKVQEKQENAATGETHAESTIDAERKRRLAELAAGGN